MNPKILNGPKSLDDIMPATRGVKLKRKTKVKNPINPTKPIIKKDVFPPPIEDLETPTQKAMNIVSKNKKVQDRLIEAMKELNKLMNITTLAVNKSINEKNIEKEIVTNLINTALEIEQTSSGEGFIALATLALRQGLSLRDAGNKLSYDLFQLNKKMDNLIEKISNIEKNTDE